MHTDVNGFENAERSDQVLEKFGGAEKDAYKSYACEYKFSMYEHMI